jgi:excisionase family DNA binding protein
VIPQYLTAKQVAERLGVSESWVLDRAARGDLPSYKLGHLRRFREDEVKAWLDSQGRVAEVRELRRVG